MGRHSSLHLLAFSHSGRHTLFIIHRDQSIHYTSRGKVYQYFSIKYTFILAVFLFEIGSLIAGMYAATVALCIP